MDYDKSNYVHTHMNLFNDKKSALDKSSDNVFKILYDFHKDKMFT